MYDGETSVTSTGTSIVESVNVDQTAAFLREAFGFKVLHSRPAGGRASSALLQGSNGHSNVILVEASSGLEAFVSSTLTVSCTCMSYATASAVRAGGRLCKSVDVAHETGDMRQLNEMNVAKIAHVESPHGLQVLLIDQRLMSTGGIHQAEDTTVKDAARPNIRPARENGPGVSQNSHLLLDGLLSLAFARENNHDIGHLQGTIQTDAHDVGSSLAEDVTAAQSSENTGDQKETLGTDNVTSESDEPDTMSVGSSLSTTSNNVGTTDDTREEADENSARAGDQRYTGGKTGLRGQLKLAAERPFRNLEMIMLGNTQGPLKASPNSLHPVPIDNDFFEGSALLLLRREPMDKSYAHMFEGKNRMFEVQVQGKFKKEPSGDLFISLEISERMKLGLLTRGLSKVLLSFGQRLNKRLHFSFGNKDDSELPHIAFPLVTSVDSMVCTPEGEEPPVLGNPLEESKQSKSARKREPGFGKFFVGPVYSFSFHSMYVDMVKWSTCKIPIMNDLDLHTFWGDSALRVTAYSMRNNMEGTKEHLQAMLDYIFCLQVRRSDHEVEDLSEEVEVMKTTNGVAAPDEERVPLPLLTDVESPRGRQGSRTIHWTNNDDASDEEDRAGRRKRRALQRQERDRSRASSLSQSHGHGELNAPANAGHGEELTGVNGSVEGASGTVPLNHDDHGREDDLGRTNDAHESDSDTSMSSESEGESDEEGEGDDNDKETAKRRKDYFDATHGPSRWPHEDRQWHQREHSERGPNIEEDEIYDGEEPQAPDGKGDSSRVTVTESSSTESEEESKILPRVDSDPLPTRKALTSGATEDAGRGVGNIRPSARFSGRRAVAAVGSWSSSAQESVSKRIMRTSSSGRSWTRGPKFNSASGVGGGTRSESPVLSNVTIGSRKPSYYAEDEDCSVRCPAYVDLYSRKPKLKGTWTAFCLTKRQANGGGIFALRSVKDLSILPVNLVPAAESHSPRLARREVKRRKIDAVLQHLTASTHSSLNPAHRVVIRALMGMQSSADRAYRVHSPAQSTSTRPGSANTLGNSQASEYFTPMDGNPEEGSSSVFTGSMPRKSSSNSAVGKETPPESPDASTKSSQSGRSGDERMGSASLALRSWGSGSKLTTVKERMVLRVLCEHHLSQQLATLVSSSLTFSRPRRKTLRIAVQDIIDVRLPGVPPREALRSGWASVDTSSQLIPGMFVIEIHTVGRVHYMLVEGLEEALDWIEDIKAQTVDENRMALQDGVSISDPFRQYMTKKSAWKTSNFWVMNCRKAEITATPDEGGWGGGCWWAGGLGSEECDYVAGLLQQVLKLHSESSADQLISFLDRVCRLRWMPLEGLSHHEQLALFINLYHVMLLHAFLLLGPPGSSLRVTSYFANLCYEVGGDIVSLAELEHSILRAKTSQPKQFLSKLIIPTTGYSFALRSPEPRVSFALNCGSISTVPGIFIYSPEKVEEQLLEATTYYLDHMTEVIPHRRTVVLPKIISWYADDFSSSSSSKDALLALEQYFIGEKRRHVRQLLSGRRSFTVKFGSWSWRCRPPSLIADDELRRIRMGMEK